MISLNSGSPKILTYLIPFTGGMNLYIRPATPVTMTKPIPIHYYILPFRALAMLLQHPNLSFKALRRLTFFRINLVPKNLPSFHQITSSFHCLNAILLPLLLYCFAVMSSFFILFIISHIYS